MTVSFVKSYGTVQQNQGSAGGSITQMTGAIYHRLALASDIPPNSMRAYAVGEADVLVCHAKDGLHALDNICSHGYARLNEGRLRGTRVICPLHGASFDCRTGGVLGAPAVAPLQSYALRIVDGWVEVALQSA